MDTCRLGRNRSGGMQRAAPRTLAGRRIVRPGRLSRNRTGCVQRAGPNVALKRGRIVRSWRLGRNRSRSVQRTAPAVAISFRRIHIGSCNPTRCNTNRQLRSAFEFQGSRLPYSYGGSVRPCYSPPGISLIISARASMLRSNGIHRGSERKGSSAGFTAAVASTAKPESRARSSSAKPLSSSPKAP
jgi:hypothetical protein